MAEPAAKSRPGANVAEFTVSELSGAIKSALEDRFGYVRVRGEISGFRGPHASGHCYFGLKDDKSKIEAVVWRGSYGKLKVKPQEGLEVVAIGRVTTYPGSSKYQIVIDAMEPAGVGALMALLEERKKKLSAEGLFDDARKKRIPFLPRVVGIVTSPTGAVIRDMLHGFAERFPTRVLVWPVRVQGETSAQEVAAAIRGFNALQPGGPIPRPDVLIVARGGGSLEDLWGFNEEIVVRAAAESRIPLISAVGHETDWTLIDLAADARAPTPTKAAEWAVPKHADLIQQTGSLAVRLATSVRRRIDAARTELKAAARGLPRPEDLVGRPRQRFDAVQARLGRALLANTRAHATRHARVAGRLHPRLLALRIERSHDRLDAMGRRARDGLSRLTAQRRTRFERSAARLSPTATAQRIHRCSERLSVLAARADRALENRILAARRRLDGQGQLLSSLGYRNVLRRGFALVRGEDGRALRSVTGVATGHHLDVELADGRIAATADGVTTAMPAGAKPEPGPTAAEPRPAATRTRVRDGGTGGGQGSLF